MITNYVTFGGDSMLNTIRKCSSCGEIQDSSFIYFNPISQKETCFFEITKQRKLNEIKRKMDLGEEISPEESKYYWNELNFHLVRSY